MSETAPPALPQALPDPIMVVDDDAFVCTVVAAALTAAGARVTCCTSGEQALAAAPDLKPALVLIDYMLPGLDGLATWTALRTKVAADSAAPIGVFLTARNAGGMASELGIAGVIGKPFDPMTFVDQLRGVLQSHAVTAVSAARVGAARLAAVGEEFARTLPGAADHIAELGRALRSEGWRRATGEALLGRAHGLAGTAGLFNRHELGAAAGEVEGLLLNYLKLDRALEPAEMRRLEAAANTLIGHCRQ